MKLIKLSSDHYIIVDDSEKVIYTTQEIENTVVPIISLSEVKELLGEVNVERKAEEMFPYQETRTDFATDECREIYKSGYKQALKDNNL